jgi:hypothetical protein
LYFANVFLKNSELCIKKAPYNTAKTEPYLKSALVALARNKRSVLPDKRNLLLSFISEFINSSKKYIRKISPANIFFACFMTDVQENIGMWSMYGQPWEDGVLLRIPKKNVVEWVKDIKTIHEISCVNFEPTGKKINIDENTSAAGSPAAE